MKKTEKLDLNEDIKYQLIDTDEKLKEFELKAKNCKIMCNDCEDIDLSRKGKLSIIQVKLDYSDIYILDYISMKSSSNYFILVLKALLEGNSILKLVFDFRNDFDYLFHCLRIKSINVLNMQLVKYYDDNISSIKEDKLAGWSKNNVKIGNVGWCQLYIVHLKNQNLEILSDCEERPLDKINLE